MTSYSIRYNVKRTASFTHSFYM